MARSVKTNEITTARASSLDLKPGGQLGKYRLAKPLGEGGSCEVWKARDSVEGIWVALKIPLAGTDGKRDNQALLREVRLVARLRHPHIMPIKNADIIGGQAVLATELSAGTLADCSRPMSVRRIISIIAQVLDGLIYAHQKRMVHCDVTPGNIFLFPKGRAALGDFGIGLERKGRMRTVDDFGTPGYVAPEQAYGRPTHRSDCFAVGLILYEYLTGFLPKWPFRWPPRGCQRLRAKTSLVFVRFLKHALAVDPDKRFADAEKMRVALLQAAPKKLKLSAALKSSGRKMPDWQKMRRAAFVKRYHAVFPASLRCTDCGEPIAESMLVCPWCGSGRNRFDADTPLTHVCGRCHRGVLPEWRFCPRCFGPGFASPAAAGTPGVRYHGRCRYCKGKLMRFMRYCPWCRRKVRRPWHVRPFPEVCSSCGWSVDSSFWNYCPWCKQRLI
ncbi:MAG TPA: serine/threonine-protein kinase [Sedimentisphaerales bacterium]|nr:serine/threonine-protein kinase [Sedimentisphaerales bacterium]